MPPAERYEQYEENGYLICHSVFSNSDLTAISTMLDNLVTGAAESEEMAECCVFERDQPIEKRDGVAIESDNNSVFIIGDLHRFCPGLLPILITPEIVNLVSDLLGTDDLMLHFINLTMKSAGIGSGINWHRDFPNTFICPTEPRMVRTMICVDGMSGEMGPTTFLPGSHQAAQLSLTSAEGAEEMVETATCAPGSVVAIHPLVLHGGPPNFSAAKRRNIIIQWGRADVPLQTDQKEAVTGLTVRRTTSAKRHEQRLG